MQTPWSRLALVPLAGFLVYGCSDSAEEASDGGGSGRGGSSSAAGRAGSAGAAGKASGGAAGKGRGGEAGSATGGTGGAGGGNPSGGSAGVGGNGAGGSTAAGAAGTAGSSGASAGGNGGGKSGGAGGASAGASGSAGSSGSSAGAAGKGGSTGGSAGAAGNGGSTGGGAGAAGSGVGDVDDSGNPKQVRTVYIVPSDKTPNPNYPKAIAGALRHLQIFYRNELGDGRSFSVYDPIVETLQSKRSTSYFATHNGGGAAKQRHYDNVADEGFAYTKGKYNDPNFRYVFYVDSDPPCGQLQGAGGDGVTVLPANDLRGLVGEKQVAICPDDPDFGFGVCRWVGGLGHELGHALGLPHPPGCDGGASDCDSNDLMWLGYSTYPKTYIRASEQTLLKASPFFSVISAPSALPGCETLL